MLKNTGWKNKMTKTHTGAHKSIRRSKRTNSSSQALVYWPTILRLCHQTGKGPPGKAEALLQLLPRSQHTATHPFPRHLSTRSRLRVGFSLFCSPSFPSPKGTFKALAAGQIPFACITNACGFTSVLPSGDRSRAMCVPEENSCPQIHQVVCQQRGKCTFSGHS